MGVGLDPHERLYSQMLDCEERFCDILATTDDVESIREARPRMQAEAKKYRELGNRFLATEGLTPEKLKGVMERSRDRQRALQARFKEQMQRLTGGKWNPDVLLAIPQLELMKHQLDFMFEAAEVASGKKGAEQTSNLPVGGPPPPPPPPPLPPEVIAREKMDSIKARMEESRARREEFRAKMEALRPKPPGAP
jgi:hypothetical protein